MCMTFMQQMLFPHKKVDANGSFCHRRLQGQSLDVSQDGKRAETFLGVASYSDDELITINNLIDFINHWQILIMTHTVTPI